MESAATSAVESSTAMEPAAAEAAAGRCAAPESATGEAAITSESASAYKAATAVKATATVEPATVEATTTIESAAIEATPAEPWSGANEDPADEPIRSIVAIGRAGVWGIAVVAIGASWSAVSIAVTRSAITNANRHSLRVGISRAKQANRNQQTSNSSNPEVSHLRTPFRVRNFLIPNNLPAGAVILTLQPYSVKLQSGQKVAVLVSPTARVLLLDVPPSVELHFASSICT